MGMYITLEVEGRIAKGGLTREEVRVAVDGAAYLARHVLHCPVRATVMHPVQDNPDIAMRAMPEFDAYYSVD